MSHQPDTRFLPKKRHSSPTRNRTNSGDVVLPPATAIPAAGAAVADTAHVESSGRAA